MGADPFKDAGAKVDRRVAQRGLGIGIVKEVPDSTGHVIGVAEVTSISVESDGISAAASQSVETATVSVSAVGDIALPSEGDLVVLARFKDRRPIVLDTIYARDATIREYAADERHISGDGGVFIHGPFGVVPKRESDPSDAPDGSAWYNTTADEYRGVENDTIVSFDTTSV